MSSRDVNGQPGWTKVSVTIDYLLVLLHITPSSVWFMQAQVETQGVFVPDGGLSLARKVPPHQNQPKPEQCIHAATPAIRPTKITSEISSTALVGPARRCRVNSHSEVAPFSCTWSRLCWRPKYHPPRGSVCADDARHACSLSTSQPNLPSNWMSSAGIIISIGISPRVVVSSTARATHRDHHWLVQWPLEALVAFRAGRGSARGLPLPHLHRFYANVVDLLLSARSIACTSSVSQTGRRSHLTGRVLAFG